MIPGEYFIDDGEINLNEGRATQIMQISNTGDRPIQVGSHFHFYEVNSALDFKRDATKGYRLNITAGTAVRFEPGQMREVDLVEFSGDKTIYGFNAKIMGKLSANNKGDA